jgi:hypothetical protein
MENLLQESVFIPCGGKPVVHNWPMANDAKLGLVLGVAIVLVIALVFFRSDALTAKGPSDPSRPTTAIQQEAMSSAPAIPSW